MKLLVLTQIVDKNDADLGFFHLWLEKFSQNVDELLVICLKKGDFSLPKNVKILSLGKEEKQSRWQYIKRFFTFIFKYHKEYDGVFVHMNFEYALLGSLCWRFYRKKKVVLWYTHHKKNYWLKLARFFVDNIFTTSEHSYPFPNDKKLRIVGHGIPVELFNQAPNVQLDMDNQVWNFLWVGRITPRKDLETVVQAIRYLKDLNLNKKITLDIIGRPVKELDFTYQALIRQIVANLQLSESVHFIGGKTYAEMPEIYRKHCALIHTSKTGSTDKVVLEAIASGLLVFSSNEEFLDFPSKFLVQFSQDNPKMLSQVIVKTMESIQIRNSLEGGQYIQRFHSLDNLIKRSIVGYFENRFEFQSDFYAKDIKSIGSHSRI